MASHLAQYDEHEQAFPNSPSLKLENSPIESLYSVSNSIENTPLFTPEATPMTTASSTQYRNSSVDAMDCQSTQPLGSPAPESDLLATLSMPLMDPPTPAPAPVDKKPTKKRKSWGQVLPEPKTNLPPRKRAKTEDEKEQRRVERVLRNRRAAQSSRERKRLEAENLEKRNRELETTVARLQRSNLYLLETLKKMKKGGPESVDSPALQALLDNPTLGRSVFPAAQEPHSPLEGMSVNDQGLATVDPARLSPGLTPIPEDEVTLPAESSSPSAAAATAFEAVQEAVNASLDSTQHPAAVLCDLQCQSTEPTRPPMTSPAQKQMFLSWILFLVSATTTAVSIWTTPLSYLTFSMKAGLPLHPSRALLNTIIWLVTRPRTSWINSYSIRTLDSTRLITTVRMTSRGPSSSSFPSRPLAAPPSLNPLAPRSRTLRSKSLKKILTSSPSLARPLADATLEVLRLVSKGRGDQTSGTNVGGLSFGVEYCGEQRRRLPVGWMPSASLPSREALITLLWAIKVEERQLSKSNCHSVVTPSAIPDHVSKVLLRRFGKEDCTTFQEAAG